MRIAVLICALVLALVLGRGAAAASEVRPQDAAAAGAARDARIVAIGGAVTEILFALGVGDRVVAVDQTSQFPAAARALPQVGYARALSPEGVLSAGPTLIIAIEGAGPKSTLDVLKAASVPVVIVPEVHTAEGVVEKIRAVAGAVGEAARGRALADAVRADFAAVEAAVAALPTRPKAVFVLAASGGAATVGGAGTSADAMLKLAGATNAMAAIHGYKPAVDEAAMAADPEAVVVMKGGGQELPPETIFALPAFMGTPAARERRHIAMWGSYLLGFGPRTPQAVLDLARALHPGAALPDLPPRAWTRDQ
ncbi:ABC transporter substrate-binding protein [Xanthobacter sp. KR7-225]|uniref:heme/hemin ABC transporter substrate-binding protein n=1 Tax=Xanthobacter sp. KR7-225 TaxID=3156613 RepID=UPI0032B5F66D